MGAVTDTPPRVLPLFAASSAYDDVLDELPDLLQERYGAIGLTSPRFDFTETDYYAAEMGGPLKKQFFCPASLAEADFLPAAKLHANALEESEAARNRHPVARPLNLDPGFIDSGKVALASTKGPPHRFYLGQGIYVESTLAFRKNEWVAWPWTYRDFRRPDYHRFLLAARRFFLELRRSQR